MKNNIRSQHRFLSVLNDGRLSEFGFTFAAVTPDQLGNSAFSERVPILMESPFVPVFGAGAVPRSS